MSSKNANANPNTKLAHTHILIQLVLVLSGTLHSILSLPWVTPHNTHALRVLENATGHQEAQLTQVGTSLAGK